MGVNVPLLRKSLEHITAHPAEWDQGKWATKTDCGTAYCLAGTAVVLAGHQIDWGRPILGERSACFTTGGRWIESVAVEELGVNEWDASGPCTCDDESCDDLYCTEDYCTEDESGRHLFDPRNTLADLWRIANELSEGEIEIPADLEG